MTTLTGTVDAYKRLRKWVIGLVIVIIATLVLIKTGGFIVNLITPQKPASATLAFGKLPKLDLSEGYEVVSGTQFTVDTISGTLPTFDPYAKVFVIEKPVSRFGDLEKAVEGARRAGFDDAPVEITGGIAKFKDETGENRLLTIGTSDLSVSLVSDYLRNPAVVINKPQSAQNAQTAVLKFFESLNLPLSSFDDAQISTENVKIENGFLEKAVSLSEANLVRVVFNKGEIEKVPIINPDSENPLVWGLADDKNVFAAQFVAWEIKKHRFSTYPIKSEEVALSDLRNGGGALNKKPNSNIFAIVDVKLGYLETKNFQPYLRPVYLFMGDDGTIAYVDAVDNSWVSNN